MMPFPPIPLLVTLTVAWASGTQPRSPAEPMVRIGLRVAEPEVEISAPGGLQLFDVLTGEPISESPPAGVVRAYLERGSIRFDGAVAPPTRPTGPVRVEVQAGGPLVVDGVAYRGRLELLAAADGGISAVNVLSLEEYLLGVVPLEIGPRTPTELAAVQAQAIAARTYAVAHLGGHAELGFDLYGTVADQAYGGVDAERPEATDGVRSTAGRILTYGGLPIRAYYHSTCGGSTAAVDEVMDRPPAPYLRSVSDRAPDGSDWCSISPRYRWTGEWSREELNGQVLEEVARMFGSRASEAGPIEELVVLKQTGSGRVQSVAFRGPGSELVLERLDIRFALRDAEGRILGSTDFDVQSSPSGGIVIHGRGFGHGAGMCQWGAIARARAGQSAEEILATYYPGAVLTRVY